MELFVQSTFGVQMGNCSFRSLPARNLLKIIVNKTCFDTADIQCSICHSM